MTRLTLTAAASALYCQWLESRQARENPHRRYVHPVEVAVGSVLSVPDAPSADILAELVPSCVVDGYQTLLGFRLIERDGVHVQPPSSLGPKPKLRDWMAHTFGAWA